MGWNATLIIGLKWQGTHSFISRSLFSRCSFCIEILASDVAIIHDCYTVGDHVKTSVHCTLSFIFGLYLLSSECIALYDYTGEAW